MPADNSVHFYCPSCQARLKGEPGRKASCPRCAQRLLVPTPPTPPRQKTVLGALEVGPSTPPPVRPVLQPLPGPASPFDGIDDPAPPAREPKAFVGGRPLLWVTAVAAATFLGFFLLCTGFMSFTNATVDKPMSRDEWGQFFVFVSVMSVLAALSGLLFCTPALIAYARRHHNRVAILALTLLLGWTFLGWVAALVWAFTEPPPRGEAGR